MPFPFAGKRGSARFSQVFIELLVIALAATTFSWRSQAQTAAASAGTASYQKGQEAMLKGDPAGARAAFEQAIKIDPQNADAQNALGQFML